MWLGPRTGGTPGPAAGTSGSLGVCFNHVMNPPSRSAAVRQSRAVSPHQRRYSANASAYVFVVLSAASCPNRRCRRYSSAELTTR